ncbi:MAG: high-affinity iron transporter [Flavobacteriales bacterium]|jgi:high-affinity iron transporter
MNEFLIVFRECLEASLIVGIVYTFLKKMGSSANMKPLWHGLIASILASIVFAIGIQLVRDQMHNSTFEKLFEGILMYLAAGFLIFMIVWMAKNVNIKSKLEAKAESSLENKSSSYWGIFGLIFFAVSREGFETVLFLFGASSTDSFSYFGFFGGLVLAVGVGVLLFRQGKRLPIKQFFNITSFLLIFFAAGMVAYGTHEVEEYFVKNEIIQGDNITRVWDVFHPKAELAVDDNASLYNFNEGKGKYYHIMHDKGSVGVFFKGFFGYNSDPNIAEVLLWLLTVSGTFLYWRKAKSALIKA